MKIVLGFVLCLLIVGCLSNREENNRMKDIELEDIANFALNKPLKYVIDSFRYKIQDLTFIQGPSGIISSLIVNHRNKGTIEFLLVALQ